MPSVMMALRLLGMRQTINLPAQAVYSFIVLVLVFRAVHHAQGEERIIHSAILIGSVAILPYFFIYDMIACSLAMLIYFRERSSGITLVYLCVPSIACIFAILTSIQLIPLYLLMLLYLLLDCGTRRQGQTHG